MRTGLAVGAFVVVVAGVSLWTRPADGDGASGAILAGAEAPAAVRLVIERSCQDCHSERTRYPWYSYVAPVSLLIRRDVARGRERLDFSRWAEYPLVRRERLLSEIANQVKEREMPLGIYTAMHRDARLSDGEVDEIFRWTQAERMRLIMGSRQ